jgi:hypothetical protein
LNLQSRSDSEAEESQLVLLLIFALVDQAVSSLCLATGGPLQQAALCQTQKISISEKLHFLKFIHINSYLFRFFETKTEFHKNSEKK